MKGPLSLSPFVPALAVAIALFAVIHAPSTGRATYILPATSGVPPQEAHPSDGIQFVSTQGNDSNDGLSWGTAKATIQAALNALPNTGQNPGTGGVVEIGCGAYSISSTIKYPANGGMVTIEGLNPECVFLNGTSSLAEWFFDSANSSIGENLSFENLTLNGASGSTAGGIHIDNADFSTMRAVRFFALNGYAVQVEPTGEGYHAFTDLFEDCSAGYAKCAAMNILADWVFVDRFEMAKMSNPAIVIGNASVSPFDAELRDVHCFQCADELVHVNQIYMHLGIYDLEDETANVNKTNNYGIYLASTLTGNSHITIIGGGLSGSTVTGYQFVNNVSFVPYTVSTRQEPFSIQDSLEQ